MSRGESGLYPRLDEPWSDVDDEGIESRYDQPTPTLHPGERDGVLDPNNIQRHSYSTQNSTDAVNLSEFEDHYLKHSSRRSPGLRNKKQDSYSSPRSMPSSTNPPSLWPLDGGAGSRAQGVVSTLTCALCWMLGVCERTKRWALAASLWKKALLAILLGLLSSMIVTALRSQFDTSTLDNYLPCPQRLDQGLSSPCIADTEVKTAKKAALELADRLQNRAAQYICGTRDVPSLTLSLGELRSMPPLKSVSEKDIWNMFLLILVNHHWNIRWMDKNNNIVTDITHRPLSSDLLVSSSPSLPIKCSLLLKLATLWAFVQWIFLFVVGAVVLYGLFALYQKRKRRRQSAVFALVTRIMDVMKYHYKKTCTKKDLLPYLAIIHVRDMLIPPSERKAKEELWNSAVEWIACHESRVRVETRRIAGQDFEVWRWIQENPPPTEIPSSQPAPSGQSGRGQGNWHGNVFEHYPPDITGKVAPPTGTPSVCIRLKNMFEPVRKMSESQIHELENAVLERCHPHGAVVHIWVDKKSPVGCVYLKMASLQTAMDSYNALHGGWYKGKLVTAKYIPEAKYHKWFPNSVKAKTPLHQS